MSSRMSGVFCQRFGVVKALFRVPGIYGSAGISSLFGSRTLSSGLEYGKRRKKEDNPGDIEACQAYLVSSCGLSPKIAENVSKTWGSLKPERVDAVLKILRGHGFDDTQVSKLVRKVPQIIFLNAEKIVLPKLKFFSSMGIASKDLARLVTANPTLLLKSLDKSLVPKLEFLKTLLGNDDSVIKAIKSNAWIFLVHAERNLAPNVTALREAGVSRHSLQCIMKHFASVVIQSPEKYGTCFDDVTKMGFHPGEPVFIQAMYVFSSTLKAGRDRKIGILKRCGMSESEIQSMFKKRPLVMKISDEKLMRNVDFLVKDMHWSPSDIVRSPSILN